MPFAFRMIAERTSDEFSIRAARWESRLAFLRSVSKAQVEPSAPSICIITVVGEPDDVTKEF